MYYLKKDSVLLETTSREDVRTAVERARQLLDDSSHGLTFYSEEHKYFLAGKEMRSVSSIVEHFAPFDSEAAAKRCSVNPRHQHYGKSPEEILALWSEEGRIAAEEGTKVHAFAEACFLYMLGKEDEIEQPLKERVTPEGLLALTPKEESVARWWQETDWRRFTPVVKETRIVNPELGYAGTMDLLLYDTYNLLFCLKDYKTNKDMERWFREMLVAPLTMIRDNDLGKYTVQQTLYTIQMDNIRLPVASNELIWVPEGAEGGYRIYELPMNYKKVIHFAVKQLNL